MTDQYLKLFGKHIKLRPGKVTQLVCADMDTVGFIDRVALPSKSFYVGRSMPVLGTAESYSRALVALNGVKQSLAFKRRKVFYEFFSLASHLPLKHASSRDRWLVQLIAVLSMQPKGVVLLQSVFFTEHEAEKLASVIHSLASYRITWMIVGTQHWVEPNDCYELDVSEYESHNL